jgi:hypothetical protein
MIGPQRPALALCTGGVATEVWSTADDVVVITPVEEDPRLGVRLGRFLSHRNIT